MELRQLESFYWIAVLGSFGSAASRLNMTQPAISSRITALERELGVALFDRTPRRVMLTPEGVALFEVVEKLMAILSEIRDIGKGASKLRRRLRLGVVNTIAHTWLPELIQRVETEYPGVHIDFEVDISSELRTRLLSHELDLIITVGRFQDPNVATRLVCRYSLDWIASASMPLPSEPIPLAEFAKLRLMTYPKRSIPHTMVQQAFKGAGVWPIKISESNSVAAMVQIAQTGIGVCIIPAAVVSTQLAAGQLRRLKTEVALPPLEFYASYLKAPLNEIPAFVARVAEDIASHKRR